MLHRSRAATHYERQGFRLLRKAVRPEARIRHLQDLSTSEDARQRGNPLRWCVGRPASGGRDSSMSADREVDMARTRSASPGQRVSVQFLTPVLPRNRELRFRICRGNRDYRTRRHGRRTRQEIRAARAGTIRACRGEETTRNSRRPTKGHLARPPIGVVARATQTTGCWRSSARRLSAGESFQAGACPAR